MERVVHAGSITIRYELERKNVKNINMHVYADGRVRVSAPLRATLKYVDELVAANAEKLLASQQRLQAKKEQRESKKLTFTELIRINPSKVEIGEFAYPLRVLEGVVPKITMQSDGTLIITQLDTSNVEQQRQLVRLLLKKLAWNSFINMVSAVRTQLLIKSGKDIPFPELKVREMKTRWGSWNVQKHIMTLNSKLIFFPKSVIEYIIVHEFCHHFEANHSERFYAWMTKLLPDWRERKRLLNEWAERI